MFFCYSHSDSSNSSSANGLSLDSIPMVYQNGYTNGLTSTRSTSPESQNSNQSNENSLIDMMVSTIYACTNISLINHFLTLLL